MATKRTQNQITIENFLMMRPDVPEYSAKNQSYLLGRSNPTYYLDSPGIQEQQLAPLAASARLPVSSTNVDGNIVHMIASTNATYQLYFITDTTHVYAVSTDHSTNTITLTSFGYPTGSSVNSTGGRLSIAAGTLFATWTGAKHFYTAVATVGSWTSRGSSGDIRSTNGVPFMEFFHDFIAMPDNDGTSSGAEPNNYLLRIDVSAYTVGRPSTINTLDLGFGWGITGLKNYNNKYLAIAAAQTNAAGTSGYPTNYLFLWDGTALSYNYALKIPGEFIYMEVINAVLYVAVQVSGTKTQLFELYNTTLRPVMNPSYSEIASVGNGTLTPSSSPVSPSIFNYYNNVGLKLAPVSELGINPIVMIYGQQDAGKSEFILSNEVNFDQFCVGYDGYLYASYEVNTPSDLCFLTYFDITSPTYGWNQLLYKSQWIPVKNAQFIDIYYDTPPQSGTDAINVVLDGLGEDIISGTQTLTLPSITPSNFLTQKRTRLTLQDATTGEQFTGSLMRITLKTVNSTWRPIIRAISIVTK